MEIKIKKIGGSLGIIIPTDLVERYGFKEDMWIDLDFNSITKLKAIKNKE